MQEGGPNINLFGSSSAVISFKLKSSGDPEPVYAFTLKNTEGTFGAAKVVVERCLSEYPRQSDEIFVDITGTALLREVIADGTVSDGGTVPGSDGGMVSSSAGAVSGGDGTVSEGDDVIHLRRVPISRQSLTLVTPAELAVQRFGLVQCSTSATELADCERLHIENNDANLGDLEQILFATAADAAALRNWLLVQSKTEAVTSIGGLAIGMAPLVLPTGATSKDLKGVKAALATKLRVVRISGNEPLKNDRQKNNIR